MQTPDTTRPDAQFWLQNLRPMISLVALVVLAVLALFSAATVATATPRSGATDTPAVLVPASLDAPASADEPMAAFGQ